MNKQEFILSLREELAKLPPEEIVDATQYFEECFAEATDGLEGEAKLAEEERLTAEFGSPKKIAAQIKSDYAARVLDEDYSAGGEKPGTKKKLSAVWWILIGICSAPIAIPLLICAAVMVFCIIVGVIACFIAGIGIVFAGFGTFATSISAGIMAIGGGLMMIAASAAAGFGIVLGIREMIRAIARSARKNREERKTGYTGPDLTVEENKQDGSAEEASADADKDTAFVETELEVE